MDRLDELLVFIAILDAGSMASAARKLGRSPAAITRILGLLESRAGARLFERSTRRLTPTETGLRLADQARRLLADYDTALQPPGAAAPRGLLRLTAPTVFGRRHVAPVVTRFLALHPDIQVDLTLSDRNVDLIEDDIDAAVRIGPLAHVSLVARRLGEVRRMTVASPAYLDRHGTPHVPADLAGHELIMSTSVRSVAEWRFRGEGREHVVRYAPRLRMNDVEAMLAATRDGFGIARALSYQVEPDLRAGLLRRLLADYEPEALPVHLVLRSSRHMAPRLRAFVDFAVGEFAAVAVIR
ncbi:LysR family transcriptional regulator [Massilia pinisoli]|uniref:LysR family transcriptional regulator n=1 Tax=Massilia pinisoli TaxID=1772194 RepID=A0ABT1ZKU9_9BURK|nr:LysR family transcriptional regulator [Massilia pinisoli]MCS0580546.1 LysR family transcriptional regulator [Massilia pinisoli]